MACLFPLDCYTPTRFWEYQRNVQIPMKTVIGVISDTHLRKVTKEFQEIYQRYLSDVDVVFHAGDFVSLEMVAFLSRNPFHGVFGNMDTSEIRKMLPEKKVMEFGEYRIGLIHGWGAPKGIEERIRNEFIGTDVIVYGHSHVAANHTKGGTLFFNPGTVTGYAADGSFSIGRLIIDDRIHGEIINIDQLPCM